jgi:DNA-binding Lrp family transcriptional regulator
MDKEVRDLNSGACGAGTSPSQPTAVPRTAKGPRGEVGAERRVRGQRKNADGHEHPPTQTHHPRGGGGGAPTLTLSPGGRGDSAHSLDDIDRAIINRLQDGFPLTDRPFLAVATELGLAESDLLTRIQHLRTTGVLTRFGPLFHAERMGGALLLAALKVPEADFDRIADLVNALPEVAHNYQRAHTLNMWFVLATETPQALESAVTEIERLTGLTVHRMPKLAEYYVDLRFSA